MVNENAGHAYGRLSKGSWDEDGRDATVQVRLKHKKEDEECCVGSGSPGSTGEATTMSEQSQFGNETYA